MSQQTHRHDRDWPLVPELRRFKLTEDMAEGKAKAKIYVFNDQFDPEDEDSEELVARGADFEVHDAFEQFGGAEGDTGYCLWWPDAQRWEVIAGGGGSVKRATLNGSLSRGGTVSATLAVGGASIDVKDWNFIPTGKSVPSGTRVFVMLEDGTWWLMEVNACAA